MRLPDLRLRHIQAVRDAIDRDGRMDALDRGKAQIPIVRGLLGQLKSVDALADGHAAEKQLHSYAIWRQIHTLLALYHLDLESGARDLEAIMYNAWVRAYTSVGATLASLHVQDHPWLKNCAGAMPVLEELELFKERSRQSLSSSEYEIVRLGTDAIFNCLVALWTMNDDD